MKESVSLLHSIDARHIAKCVIASAPNWLSGRPPIDFRVVAEFSCYQQLWLVGWFEEIRCIMHRDAHSEVRFDGDAVHWCYD